MNCECVLVCVVVVSLMLILRLYYTETDYCLNITLSIELGHFVGCKGVRNHYRFTVSSVSDELGHFALSSVFCLLLNYARQHMYDVPN